MLLRRKSLQPKSAEEPSDMPALLIECQHVAVLSVRRHYKLWILVGASCTQRKISVVSFGSISYDSFLTSILLLVVIMVTVVVVVVTVILVIVVIAIVGVVIVVVIIRIVVVIDGVSSILKLLFVILGFEVVTFPSILLGNPPMKTSMSFSEFGTMFGHKTANSWNLLISSGTGLLHSSHDPTNEDGDAKMDDSTGFLAPLGGEIFSRGRKSWESYSDNTGEELKELGFELIGSKMGQNVLFSLVRLESRPRGFVFLASLREDAGDDLNGGVGSAIYRVKEAFVPKFSSWIRLKAAEESKRKLLFIHRSDKPFVQAPKYNLFKRMNFLSSGKVTFIDAMTEKDNHIVVQDESELNGYFTRIYGIETSQKDSTDILKGIKQRLVKLYNVEIPNHILEYTVKASYRYAPRQPPFNAINLLDRACAMVRQDFSGEVDKVARLRIDIIGLENELACLEYLEETRRPENCKQEKQKISDIYAMRYLLRISDQLDTHDMDPADKAKRTKILEGYGAKIQKVESELCGVAKLTLTVGEEHVDRALSELTGIVQHP
uniref:ClpA/ClpB AAA lid domain-containing protein n=1 Tax=Tanacetum cinerariifolium TaxID=118510 RepID=A0A6L2KLU0_TANCI|nr:hypothetical protein [Tanacetum cinerariifolium]